jgi:hypothetical protein
MKFLSILMIVIALAFLVPAFMIICWLYPLWVLAAFIVLALTMFLAFQPEAKGH